MKHYSTANILSGVMMLCIMTPAYAADVVVDGTEMRLESITDGVATIRNGGTLHLTSATPLNNATINIADDGVSTLILEALYPSEAAAQLLDKISFNGRPVNLDTDRLSMYGNGCELYSKGWENPLTVYTEANYGGASKVCMADIYYRGVLAKNTENFLEQEKLNDFDNNIRSFKLRRGFQATFANISDGTGFSRCFTAVDEDLEVPVMPEGLGYVSFIRVCRADRLGKRGMCNAAITPLTRSAWFYTWGASDESTMDYEFVPMRHNKWWDGWDKIGSRINASQVLGYNEPDHSDQSDLSPDWAISQWPEFMKSGLRAGSPAPDCINKQWLRTFIAMADSLNYRVDFVATHMYWDSQNPVSLCNTINNLCTNDYGGRPMWITEWNNGANWTHENWPDKRGTRLDADFNVLLDENGKQTTVDRPHTRNNSAKQVAWLEQALAEFDNCQWLERHSLYNWVEDARALVIEDKLTPAGRLFAAFQSVPAFSREREYIHTWRIAPPLPHTIQYSSYFEVSWADYNGENGKGYVVERRINGGEWQQVSDLKYGDDYRAPGRNATTVKIRYTFAECPDNGMYDFRVKAIANDGSESIWSRLASINVTSASVIAPETPRFSVTAVNGEIVITSDTYTSVNIYSADGRMVRTVAVSPGETTVSGLSRGVYLVNTNKVLI